MLIIINKRRHMCAPFPVLSSSSSSEAATERTGSGTFGGRRSPMYANLTSRVTECFTMHVCVLQRRRRRRLYSSKRKKKNVCVNYVHMNIYVYTTDVLIVRRADVSSGGQVRAAAVVSYIC